MGLIDSSNQVDSNQMTLLVTNEIAVAILATLFLSFVTRPLSMRIVALRRVGRIGLAALLALFGKGDADEGSDKCKNNDCKY